MRYFGHFLMGVGAAVGVVVGMAMSAHFGLIGVPWLVNVALAKLGLIASGGLIAGGAIAVRVANRREKRLPDSRPPS